MHYYQHNIGDYRKDTSHLSTLEHGIYRQLLDWYYLDEQPIPKETQVVMRRLRLGSESDKSSLENVLADFFILKDDGYHQARCDIEIVEYQKNAEKNRENGKKGGRPKASRYKEENQLGSFGLAKENPTETQTKGNQEPITNNHKPNIKPKKAAPSDSVFDEAWLLYPKRPGASKQGSLKAWMARIKSGADPKAMIEGVKRYSNYCKALEIEPQFIKQPATFFGPDEHYLSDWTFSDKTKPLKKEDKSWMFTEAGIEAKAKELGLSATGYDTYETLKEKCRKRIIERVVA